LSPCSTITISSKIARDDRQADAFFQAWPGFSGVRAAMWLLPNKSRRKKTTLVGWFFHKPDMKLACSSHGDR